MNILTFDIEEWFHLLNNETTSKIANWNNYESRIHVNMDRIFSILETHNQKATFFCLGWIAKKYPEIIKKICKNGYEIASHTNNHQLIYEQAPKKFADDLEESVKILEDISGQKIKYFRAPGFSIREDNKWAFEILINLGIEVDCSIFPANRAHGGFPSFKEPRPSLIKYNNQEIKELPINYTTIIGKPIIFSGGGYFRLLPYKCIKRWTKKSDYIMSYFHPRDFDYQQPIITELSYSRKFKTYVGLKNAQSKFEKWLTDFEFIDINTALNKINWKEAPKVEL